MAAPADYFDAVDLKAALTDGLINEDVMQKIWDISHIPLPFTEMIGSDSVSNDFTEWTEDELASPDLTNAVVSGADAGTNKAAAGTRLGNHCQNSEKTLEVTERAQSTDNIGRGDELAYQLMMRQQELRRDVEAIALSNQASVADNNNTTAGKTGGFSAFLTSNTSVGVGGSNGGYNTSTKIVDAPTDGAARELSKQRLDDIIESIYINNGDPSVIMSGPEVVRRLNDYFLANRGSNGIAAPTANVSGGESTAQTAQGFVNVYVSQFGFTLAIKPNRLQQKYATAAAVGSPGGTGSPVGGPAAYDVFVIDPARVALGYLKSYQTKPLAKLGLSERAQISVDWCVKTYVEKAHGVIRDIIPTAAVVQSNLTPDG